MSEMQLTTGEPVPEDRSHTKIDPSTGMQQGYVVLTPEERAKGFVKRVRRSYVHNTCGVETRMGQSLAETYARDPHFYNGTYCVACKTHFPLNEFVWDPDGEPMDPLLQPAWAEEEARRQAERKLRRESDLMRQIKQLQAELDALRNTP